MGYGGRDRYGLSAFAAENGRLQQILMDKWQLHGAQQQTSRMLLPIDGTDRLRDRLTDTPTVA